MKNESGITLVSLVVTVIIMLILASVSIGCTKTGLIDKAKNAKMKAEQSIVKEKVDMAISECEFEYFETNSGDIVNYLYENLTEYLNEFDNVELTLETEKILLTFEYDDNEYSFVVSPNGTSYYGKKLFGNVNVGEFVSYPKAYTDVISQVEYNSDNGWVVIDDGNMNGTSGYVKIMSYGIPGKWLCKSLEASETSGLRTNFQNEKISCYDGSKIYLSEMLVSGIATNISGLTLKEVNNAYNKLYGANRAEDCIDGEISNGNDMFCNQVSNMYWLINGENLLMVADKKIVDMGSATRVRSGVKIVITLDKSLTGKLENGVWKINN